MKIERLKELYNRLDAFSVRVLKNPDFDYLQTEIASISMAKDELGTIIGEILVEKTRIENILTNKKFEYNVEATDLMITNSDVKNYTSEKERRSYIDFFLMKDKMKITQSLDQELSDVDKLMGLAKKKSRDLDEKYKWLKTQWDIILAEKNFIKKMGSDETFIDQVKNKIDNDVITRKPVFSDSLVDELKDIQETKKEVEKKEDVLDTIQVSDTNTGLQDIEALLKDL